MLNLDRLLDTDTLTPDQEKHLVTLSYYKYNVVNGQPKLRYYASLDDTNQKRNEELRKDLVSFLVSEFVVGQIHNNLVNDLTKSVTDFESELKSTPLRELYQRWTEKLRPETKATRFHYFFLNFVNKRVDSVMEKLSRRKRALTPFF